MALLEVKSISKRFGGLKAVDKVSFSVEKGELSAIIGPNGAGKTTLFNLINGYYSVDSGKIIFNGEDITNLPNYKIVQRKIGRSFQRTNIFGGLSVLDNIRVAIFSSMGKSLCMSSFFDDFKLVDERSYEILESVGLQDYKGRIANSLSHGDQRLLEIGVALASNPILLLLDEPTSGMSPEETRRTVELIRRICLERELTIIFIEHDMDVVFDISDWIRVLHQGRLIAEGTPKSIADNEEVRIAYLGT
jgi:branched-chain amino acid transport system ATP-binding protein